MQPIEYVGMVFIQITLGQKRILYRTLAIKLSQTPSSSSFINFHHRGTERQVMDDVMWDTPSRAPFISAQQFRCAIQRHRMSQWSIVQARAPLSLSLWATSV
jgi:hypothetical protein